MRAPRFDRTERWTAVFGNDNGGWTRSRGLDDALACQDVLALSPTAPNRGARWLAALRVSLVGLWLRRESR